MGVLLGAYLKKQRKLSGKTVQDVVTCTNISKGMINYIESGTREPSFSILARLSAGIGITDLSAALRLYEQDECTCALDEVQSEDAKKLLKDVLDKNRYNTVSVAYNPDKCKLLLSAVRRIYSLQKEAADLFEEYLSVLTGNQAESLEELQEYTDLEEQKILTSLSCEKGDVVWITNKIVSCVPKIFPLFIEELSISENGTWISGNYEGMPISINLSSGTVYKTQEEAENALKTTEGSN